jgi:hypothetical protein
MVRIALLSSGIALLVTGCVLLFFGLLGQGIDDGEWRNISETGMPSGPERFSWSAWRPNDGSVYPFSYFQREPRPETLPEFRVGHAKGFLFDFIFYQGRFPHEGTVREFPAIGPDSGARYHWVWAFFVLVLGGCFLFIARLTTRTSLTSAVRPIAL